jgi:hypothetical protein
MASWVMCAEDFIRLVTAEVKKMSEKVKAEFRRGWIRKSPKFFQRGDELTVRQFNGKLLKGHIESVLESVSGRKLKIVSGPLVLTVDEKQVSLTGVKQK